MNMLFETSFFWRNVYVRVRRLPDQAQVDLYPTRAMASPLVSLTFAPWSVEPSILLHRFQTQSISLLKNHTRIVEVAQDLWGCADLLLEGKLPKGAELLDIPTTV